jgi:predicted ester cyclase
MSAEANIELVREWVERIWNAGDLALLAHFHPSIFTNHDRPTTIEETRQWHLRNRVTFPDIHYTIDDMFATDDRVALRWSASATHRGALWGMIPATEKTITWNGMHLLRLANKQIVEVWAVQDSIAQLQQMGVTLHPAAEADDRR